jgi:hypothetical protein
MPATRAPIPLTRSPATPEARPPRVFVRGGVARFFTLVLFALVAGVLWGTWISLSRSIDAISPPAFVEVGWIMIRNLARPMAVLLPLALLCGLVTLARTARTDPRASVAATAIGVLLLAAALVVTLAVSVPLDHQIRQWTPTALPEGWERVRDRWEFYHGLRTFLSVAALLSVIAGAVLRRTKRAS